MIHIWPVAGEINRPGGVVGRQHSPLDEVHESDLRPDCNLVWENRTFVNVFWQRIAIVKSFAQLAHGRLGT